MHLLKKEKIYPIYASLLSASVFIVILTLSNIIGYENNTIYCGNLYQQGVPFIKLFLRGITGQESFWYSFSLFYGSGTALTHAYYNLNPLYLLYFIDIVPESVITLIILTLKISLSAASFQFFMQKTLKLNSARMISLTLAYSLGGYTTGMFTNMMLLDVLYILPILVCLTIKAADDAADFPFVSLSLCFAYLFITNFYTGFMTGVFISLVFILSLLQKEGSIQPTELIKKTMKYGATVLLAAGLCAFILLPAAFFLFSHRASDNDSFATLRASIPDIINTLFCGNFPGFNNKTPYLYSTLPVFLLAPFCFTVMAQDRRRRVLLSVLLIFLLLCTILLPLYSFMHAFDTPNQYTFRFSFLISFTITAMAALALSRLDQIKTKVFIFYSISLIVFYVIMLYTGGKRYDAALSVNSMSGLLINCLFLLSYLLLFILQTKKPSAIKKLLPILFSMIIIAEVTVNSCISLNRSGPYTSESELSAAQNEATVIDGLKSNDSGFYRISVNNEYNSNAPALFGYPGLNTFSSSDEYLLRRALYRLGISTFNRVMLEKGYTPVTYALSGTKYMIDLQDGSTYVKQNDKYLPIMFMTGRDILDYSAGDDPFENQNRIMSCLYGQECTFFIPLDRDRITTEYYNTEITEDNQIICFNKENKLDENAYYSFAYSHKEDQLFYACFYQEQGTTTSNTMNIYCADTGWSQTPGLKQGCIVEGVPSDNDNADEKEDTITVFTTDPYLTADVCKKIYFYAYPAENNLKKICDELTMTAPEIISADPDDIKADVNVSQDRQLLFTTIPYDKDWKIYCDGIEIETISTVEGAFLAANLPVGSHSIELKYSPHFAWAGMIISILSLITISIVFLLTLKRKKGLIYDKIIRNKL